MRIGLFFPLIWIAAGDTMRLQNDDVQDFMWNLVYAYTLTVRVSEFRGPEAIFELYGLRDAVGPVFDACDVSYPWAADGVP